MKCTNCKNELPEEARSCSQCGTPTSPEFNNISFRSGFFLSDAPADFQSRIKFPLTQGEILLERFKIKHEIGFGPASFVYLAEDNVREEEVALKVVPVGYNYINQAAHQLAQELRTRKRINDFTHIIKAYDVHPTEIKGIPILILPMEYAGGGNLRKWLVDNSQNFGILQSQGVQLFIQACMGVLEIHKADLIHLDLKPENLLLVVNDEGDLAIKVSDLGLSIDVKRFSIESFKRRHAGNGTPQYMSPEQYATARKKDLDHRSDIYSLGIILFEILDGDLPFDGTREELKHKHLEVSPPSLKDIEGGLANVVKLCLEKKPENRIQQVEDIIKVITTGENCHSQSQGNKFIENRDQKFLIKKSITWIEKLITQVEIKNTKELADTKIELNKIEKQLSELGKN